jgi:ubiquinol-cytochrome c reductase cytochrome b subunit
MIGKWFDDRLALGRLYEHTIGHRIPASSASWWYVFGSATLVCLIIQLVTGTCLALIYVPSPDDAYASIEYLDYEQPMGWYLRGLHYWGSNFMVALVTIHMTQIFLFGAYKFPRELTWIVGSALFLATIGMAFTGQTIRFDQDAYWGVEIIVSILGRLPGVGEFATQLLQGGPIVGAETLSRFFVLHVFVIPAALIALLVIHIRLVLVLGISEYPKPGKNVDRGEYCDDYERVVEKTGIRLMPEGGGKDLVFSALVVLAIVLCAALIGPKIPNGPADPSLIQTVPRPDFYFLSLFAAFALMPPYLESFVIVYLMPLAVVLLFAVPFISRGAERHPSRRPGAVIVVVVVLASLFTLAWEGVVSPWSPQMDAWSGVPVQPRFVAGRSPLEHVGATLLQAKQCRNCHALDGEGGQRGPDLAGVATRLTEDQLIRQVLQGGGNMPAYGKHLAPHEVTALVAFLATLHPANVPPARSPVSATRPATETPLAR